MDRTEIFIYMDWFIQIHRKILEWEWYDDINTFKLFMHLLLTANYKESKWRGETIDPWQLLTWRKQLSEQTWLSEQQIRTALEKLESTWEVTSKVTNKYSILTLNNWASYNQQDNKRVTNNQPTSNQQVTTSNKDNNINNDNKELSIDTELAPIYWKEEINMMQQYLRQVVGVTQFKDSKERWYVTHCYNLMKKIGKDEFNARLKWILQDDFKAKNCNKLAYLYGELKSYIHSPIVETEQKGRIRVTSV